MKKGIEKRSKNLKPFKPGESGNPKGRPPKRKLPELKAILDEVFGGEDEVNCNGKMKDIMVAMAKKAVRGNVQAAKLIIDMWEYVHPKLQRSSIDVDFGRMTDEQVDALYERIIQGIKTASNG